MSGYYQMRPTQRVIQQGSLAAQAAQTAIDSAASEQRWAKRRQRNTPALIVINSQVFGSRAAPIACVLKDTSSTGARIELARGIAERWIGSSGGGMPERFHLQIPSELIEVECEVAWAERNMIGVRFTAPARVMKRPSRPVSNQPDKKTALSSLTRMFSK